MDNSHTLWIACPTATLPFRPEAMGRPAEPLHTLVDCGEQAQALRWRLDWQQLHEHDRTWIESGEYLPALVSIWLAQAAALLRWCTQQACSAAVLHVPSRRLVQLSISDLMHAMGGDAWLADAQVALVWGFAHDALMQPHALRRPLLCRGAVFPCGDGLDVGWWALPADIKLIGHPD